MGDFKHLSVHQWIRSAIPDSQQPTSPIGFLFLKLPPPPCAVLLVFLYSDPFVSALSSVFSISSTMEHKRDADAAGLSWPRTTTRSPDASSAMPKNPPEPATTPSATTLASSSSASENPATNLGMYSATPGTQPRAPFPTSGHHHIISPHHGRFNKRLVHQICFKIFTYSNNTQELSIMEIPSTGNSRTRDPEHFFPRAPAKGSS